MSTDSVTLTHPTIPGSRYSCAESQRWIWEDRGWQPAPADDAAGGDAAAEAPASRKTLSTSTPAKSPAKDTKES